MHVQLWFKGGYIETTHAQGRKKQHVSLLDGSPLFFHSLWCRGRGVGDRDPTAALGGGGETACSLLAFNISSLEK